MMKRENYVFLNDEHRHNFEELMVQDNVAKGDGFREVFFYMMAYPVCKFFVKTIYNFENREIISANFPYYASSSEQQLLKLAMYLFTCGNGGVEMDSINTMFWNMGNNETELALSALRYLYTTEPLNMSIEEYILSQKYKKTAIA